MIEKSCDPQKIIDKKKLTQISDELTIVKMCEEAITESSKAVIEFKSGKKKAIGAIIGIVMKKSNGRANPQIVNKILIDKLKTIKN
jgi:aspartyl-tRNA(Asn)/glutamyl-tRNA(Gln) amidotransferase subunit B